MTIVLSSYQGTGYTQKQLVNDHWQQRTHEILPELKKEWAAIARGQPVTRGDGVSGEDLLDAIYIPRATFILDYNSYMGLTSESNLEFLLKLDTTRVDYYILDAKTNKMISHSGGIFFDGQWKNNGFGGIVDSGNSNNVLRLYTKNISVYTLWVFITSEQTRGFNIFIEDGQLMCFRPDIPDPKPLLKTLIEFRERDQRKRKLGLE